MEFKRYIRSDWSRLTRIWSSTPQEDNSVCQVLRIGRTLLWLDNSMNNYQRHIQLESNHKDQIANQS
jgi:hypothetical protein